MSHPRTSVCLLSLVLMLTCLHAVPATLTTTGLSRVPLTMKYSPGELIVKLRNGATFSEKTLKSLNEKYHVYSMKNIFPHADGTILSNIFLLHVPSSMDILACAHDYSLSPDVVYAQPNHIGTLCVIPNDTNFSEHWSLQNTGQLGGTPGCDIDAPAAWNIEKGNPDVVIAVIDTGIDATHPDLATKIWTNPDEIADNGIDDDGNGYVDDTHGWDFYYNDSTPDDGYGHGTFCAGIAAAVTNNNMGIAGVAWNCRIMPLKIINENGTIFEDDTAEAIKYAADNGADVLSMSFTYLEGNLLHDAVEYASAKGACLCAAAGNRNTSNKQYPAAYDNVIAVAATTQNDTRCTPEEWGPDSGSNYGDWVDIAAPGNYIYSTMPTYHVTMNDAGYGQNYTAACGTSASAPMVAGVAALLFSHNPALSSHDVETLLCYNSDPYNSSEYIGAGRLNAHKALDAPVADFMWTPHYPCAHQPVSFEASGSHDPNGTIAVYEWDWNNDGIFEENHTSSTATHTWGGEGIFPVVLRVIDQQNKIGEITKTISINGSINLSIKITGGWGFSAMVTNVGTVPSDPLQWTINLTGGSLLVGRVKSGVLLPLQPGDLTTIRDSPVIGFGKTTIRVDIVWADDMIATQTETGIVVLFFGMTTKK